MSVGIEGTPYSLEAEQAIVAVLFSEHGPDAFNRLALKVSADDFFVAAHGAVYAAFAGLVDEGLATDPAILSTRIKSSVNVTDEIKKLLADAAAFPYVLDNVERYGEVVAEKAKARRITSGLKEITKKAGRVGGELTANDLLREVDALAQSEYQEAHGNQILESPNKALQTTLDWLQRRSDGQLEGVRTGVKSLDDFLGGVMEPDLVVIAARPSMGKTALGLNIATNVALPKDSEDRPLVAVFSLEMGTEQITLRNLANLGSIDYDRLRRAALTDDDYSLLTYAIAKYDEGHIHIDCDPYLTPSVMRAKLRILMRQTKKPLAAVVVDYLQLMEPDRVGQNRAAEVTDISKSLKRMAKEFKTPVFALSQLNRSVENRPNKRPVMADLRESGAIEQDADTIIMLYRDEYYNPDTDQKGVTELIIPKNRAGKTGTVAAAFVGQYQRFGDLAFTSY